MVIAPRVSALLVGKGGGRKGRYQGKASQLQKRKEAEELLREFMQQNSGLKD